MSKKRQENTLGETIEEKHLEEKKLSTNHHGKPFGDHGNQKNIRVSKHKNGHLVKQIRTLYNCPCLTALKSHAVEGNYILNLWEHFCELWRYFLLRICSFIPSLT